MKIIFFVFFFYSLSTVAFAQATLTKVDEINYQEISKYNVQKTGNYHSLLEAYYLLNLYKDNPSISTADATSKMADFEKQLTSISGDKKYNDLSSYLNDIAVGAAGTALTGPAAPVVVGAAVISFLYKGGSDLYTKLTDNSSNNYFSNQLTAYNLGAYSSDLVLNEVWEFSQKNVEFGGLLNSVTGSTFNASPFETVSSLMSHNPDFADQVYTKDMLQKIQENQLTEKDLVTAFAEKLAQLNQGEKENNDLLQKILNDKATAEEIQNQIQSDNLRLQAANSAISIFSSIALILGNPELGKDISVIGGNTIQVASSISKFDQIASKFGDDGQFLSSIILSGNILSAAINIFNLFSSGPTPDQQIMKQLQGLSNMVDTLYHTMNKRFDIVDIKLDTIYSTMINGFNAIQKQEIISAQVLDDLASSQAALQTKISSMDKRIMDRLDEIFKDDLLNTCVEIFNYKEVVKDGIISSDRFTNFLLTLSNGLSRTLEYSRLMNDALTDNNSDLYDDFSRRCENEIPINFFKDIVRTKLGGISDETVIPDPGIWLTATNGLIKLINDFPDMAKRKINTALLDNFINQGEQILDFQNQLKITKDSTGTHPNYKIIDLLIDSYQKHANDFFNQIYEPTTNVIVSNDFNSIHPFILKQGKYTPNKKIELAINGKPFMTDDTVLYKFLDSVDLIPQTLGLGKIRLDFTDFIPYEATAKMNFTHIINPTVYPPIMGQEYQLCGGEINYFETMFFSFNFCYVTNDNISTPMLHDKLDDCGPFFFKKNAITYNRYVDALYGDDHIIGNDFQNVSIGEQLTLQEPDAVFKNNFNSIYQLYLTNYKYGENKTTDFEYDKKNLHQLDTQYFYKSYQKRAVAYLNEIESDFQNIKSNPIGDNAKGALDFYYQLIYEYCKLALPNTYLSNERLLEFLSGDRAILNTNSTIQIMNDEITILNQKYDPYGDFDWDTYLNVRLNDLKDVIHQELADEVKNGINDKFNDIEFAINILKLQKKILQ